MAALLDQPVTFKKEYLGEILIDRMVINRNQLNHALRVQEDQGGQLGELLMELGYLNEDDLVSALVIQCHVPYIAIDQYDIDEHVLRVLPGEFARKNHVVPLDYANNILNVVMGNPLDNDLKIELQRLTRCRIVPFIAKQSEINRAIRRWYQNYL